jgi:hypothetical protein
MCCGMWWFIDILWDMGINDVQYCGLWWLISFFPQLFLVDQRPLLCIYSPLPTLRGQPTAEYHPRWQPILGLADRLGRLPDLNPGLQVYSLVSLPIRHHCSQRATIAPDEPPLLQQWWLIGTMWNVVAHWYTEGCSGSLV